MSSSHLAILILKNSLIPEKQLRIFLSNLSKQSLKEHLSEANIYNERRNMNKDKSKLYTSEDDSKLSQEEVNSILKLNEIFQS